MKTQKYIEVNISWEIELSPNFSRNIGGYQIAQYLSKASKKGNIILRGTAEVFNTLTSANAETGNYYSIHAISLSLTQSHCSYK